MKVEDVIFLIKEYNLLLKPRCFLVTFVIYLFNYSSICVVQLHYFRDAEMGCPQQERLSDLLYFIVYIDH